MMKKYGSIVLTLVLLSAGIAGAGTTDIMFVVDESGSMAGEHAWIGNMVTQLDTALNNAGVTGNQYALVGFGGYVGSPRSVTVGTGSWGTAADLSAAAGTLTVSGSYEDGYAGMSYGLDNYTWRSGAVSNIILITDEDRDGSSPTYSEMLAKLDRANSLLNVVVNASFQDATQATMLGVSADGTPYAADGSGGYVTGTAPGLAVGGSGSTIADYVNLAWSVNAGGAAWDLNQLRAGGATAQSFTDAFVAVKVQETENVIPAPAALVLGSLGMGLVGWMRRRRTL